MRRRPIAILVLAACTGGAAPAAAPVPVPPLAARYGPGQVAYQMIEHRHVEQVSQGQSLTTDLATTIALTVTLSPRDSGLAATFVIDSVSLSGGPVFPAAAVDGARGARFEATLLRDGALVGLDGERSGNPLLQQIAFLLWGFFPGTRPDGVVAGAYWVDTTDDGGTSGGADIRRRSINTRNSPAWTTIAGVQALEIVTDATVEIAGSGMQAGQAFTVTGSGRGHARQYLSADGRLMGGTHADTATIQIELTGTGIVIPVTQRTADTLRVVS